MIVRDKDGLLSADPILDPAVRIKSEWGKAISKMGSAKAAGPSGIVVEMLEEITEPSLL